MGIDIKIEEAKIENNKKSNFHKAENEKLKIGIMGGTFDPIHYAHLATAEYVRENFNLDKVVFIPTGNPPHKAKLRTDKVDRYNMVVLATSNNENFITSDMEINREKRTYTVDTLKELHKTYPNSEIYFITGADTICDMENWRNVGENFKLATFVAATRPGISGSEAKEKIERLEKLYNADIKAVDVPSLDISSTYIREQMKEQKSVKYLIPDDVQKYIEEKNIYTHKL
ncbi:MAG: nicotinate-nucleotide adenylyltransferase [Paraclostridium sp.]